MSSNKKHQLIAVIVGLLPIWACSIVPDRNVKPVASFEVKLPDPKGRKPGQWDVTFDASASFDPQGSNTPTSSSDHPPSSYIWDFGDAGSPQTELDPEVSKTYFVESGTFVVTLQVSDVDGDLSEPFSRQIELRPNRPPVARFSIKVDRIGSIFIATFDAGDSFDPDESENPVLRYTWTYGDGSGQETFLNATTQHQYQTGTYVVKLIVSDGLDDSAPALGVAEVR